MRDVRGRSSPLGPSLLPVEGETPALAFELLAVFLRRLCILPVCHGSCILTSGLAVLSSGTMTRRSTLVATLSPSSWLIPFGWSQSAGSIMDGGSPWARHASSGVALLQRLPIHGRCFRECRRQGKYSFALRDSARALDCCSSTTQSRPSSAMVRSRAAVRRTQTASAGGRAWST